MDFLLKARTFWSFLDSELIDLKSGLLTVAPTDIWKLTSQGCPCVQKYLRKHSSTPRLFQVHGWIVCKGNHFSMTWLENWIIKIQREEACRYDFKKRKSEKWQQGFPKTYYLDKVKLLVSNWNLWFCYPKQN